MSQKTLLQPFAWNGLSLKNRVVMAPMTRTRATYPGDLPNEMNVAYYQQRASAGLIITEATNVSQQGTGYLWSPGIYTDAQVAGWSAVVRAVHEAGGKIFLQLFHTGRLSHTYFQQHGAGPVAPSAVRAEGLSAHILNYHGDVIAVPFEVPEALDESGVREIKSSFVNAAINAINAGFDGVEIHAANGFLLDQFLNASTNLRTDNYGGSVGNRIRLIAETVEAVIAEIGAEKTAVRLSPFGTLNGMNPYEGETETQLEIIQVLDHLKIAYLHLFDQRAFGTGKIPNGFLSQVRRSFSGTLILCGGFDLDKAEEAILQNQGDLIAFGRAFISNPDLIYRMENGLELSASDQKTWYGANGAAGYIDYLPLAVNSIN